MTGADHGRSYSAGRHGQQRALVVPDKAERVRNFHHKTVEALAEIIAAVGLDRPDQLAPAHVYERTNPWAIKSFDQLYSFYEPGRLLEHHAAVRMQRYRDAADAGRFSAS